MRRPPATDEPLKSPDTEDGQTSIATEGPVVVSAVVYKRLVSGLPSFIMAMLRASWWSV